MKTASVRRLALPAAALALALFAAACATAEMARNRRGVDLLRQGMTRDEVRAVLGEPLANESYHEPDVWHYYTQRRWADGAITRDECTPVVFADGRVVGWGHDFLRQYRHEQW